MKPEQLLLLENEELSQKVVNFFDSVKNDINFRQAYLENPTETLIKEVLPQEYHPDSARFISDSNRLLFSLIANPDFRNWALDYQNNLIQTLRGSESFVYDKNQIIQDVAQAIVDYGDKNIIFSLINKEPVVSDRISLVAFFVVVVVALAVVVLICVVTVGSGNSRPMLNPLQDVNLNITPQEFASICDQLIARAEELSTSGALCDPCKNFG